MNIRNALMSCSSGACKASHMPLLQVVSELWMHMPSHLYMQYWGSQYICYADNICSSQASVAHAMPSLSAISELVRNMPCLQVLLVLHCIALYCVALLCMRLQQKPYRSYGPYALGVSKAYCTPSLHAILELTQA